MKSNVVMFENLNRATGRTTARPGGRPAADARAPLAPAGRRTRKALARKAKEKGSRQEWERRGEEHESDGRG